MSETPPAAAADAWTVRRVLEWTTQHLQKHGSETPRLDAEILLAQSRGCPRIALYTQFDDILSDSVRARMRELVQRRAQNEPVAYLVGHREFFSLDFLVNKHVLIPRPDTETLVTSALDALKARFALSPRPRRGGEGQGEIAIAKEIVNPPAGPRVLDLCTGSGCVAIAIAKNFPTARVTATDLSAEALEVASQNVARHAVTDRVQLVRGDLFAAVPGDAEFDVIVSNPPYIATAELATLAADVRNFEPQGALDGGPDGLDFVRRIVAEAGPHLVSGGSLLIEISPEQGDAVEHLLHTAGPFLEVRLIKDLAGKTRVAAGKKK